MYRQYNQRANLSIENGTGAVPLDGKYYVINDGNLVRGFRGLKAAQELYQKLLQEKDLPPLKKDGSRLSLGQMLISDWSLRSNKSLLGISGSSRGRKSGRFHKVR